MTFLRVIGFSVIVLLFYTVYAHYLPQVEPDTSPPEVVSTDGLDMAGMISLGETLFSGKGTCTLCHNGMGRAPDTLEMDLALTFASRLDDAGYKGTAAGKEGPEAVEEYIRESMLDPSAYVVQGFGKKGTNDTESPMPIADAPPIELTAVETNAVIAFLQDRAALAPTVPLPSADEAPADEPAAGTQGMVAAPLTDVADIIDEYGCAACHDLNGSGADIGPAMNGIGTRMTRLDMIEAIIDPNAVIAEGYEADFMPADFGDSMHVSELILLADYLLALPQVAAVPVDQDEPPAETAIEAIDNYGCAGCHDLEGSEADLGPTLNGLGGRMSREEVEQAILDPNAVITEGYDAEMMPDYFGDEMAESELLLIVDYLMNLPE